MRFTKFVASIFLNCKGNSKSPLTRRTSLKSLCFLASDVILQPTIGLKLNQLSAELFFSIVNSHLILFIRRCLFQVAGNTFPLNYLDAITSLCTQKVYWTDMLRNIKFRHQLEITQYYFELHRYVFSFYWTRCFEINPHVLIQFLQTKARFT